MSDNDLYYLRAIRRRLLEFRSVIPDDVFPSLGSEALADEIDWLDCFIDAQQARLVSG